MLNRQIFDVDANSGGIGKQAEQVPGLVRNDHRHRFPLTLGATVLARDARNLAATLINQMRHRRADVIRLAHRVERVDDIAKRLINSVPVEAGNVRPHLRCGPRNPRHIAKSWPGKRHIVLAERPKSRRHSRRRRLGGVRHAGHREVMVVCRHFNSVGLKSVGNLAHECDGRWRCIPRADHPWTRAKQVALCREGARHLAPGHWVRAHVALAQTGCAGCLEDGRLHARHIGDNGVGKAFKRLGHKAQRHRWRRGHNDELRLLEGRCTAGADAARQDFRLGIGILDRDGPTFSAQTNSDRRPDETGANDVSRWSRHGHWARSRRSATALCK